MRYDVTIQETLARTVQVEADSESDAEFAVRCLYKGCDIVLDAEDYVRTDFLVESCEGSSLL